MKSVSVIIPTHNKARYLDLTLASYERQTHRDFELVIIDDGSSDDTARVIASYAGRLPLKPCSQDNRGRAAARNAGIDVAEGEIIVFSDDDRVVVPEFVAAHAREFTTRSDLQVMGWQHGLVTVWRPDLPLDTLLMWRFVARGVLPHSGHGEPLVQPGDVRDRLPETVERYGLDERWWTEGCLPIIERYGPDFDGFAIPWILGTTGNLSVPRRAVIECGKFDAQFSGWGLEDLDLCYRLHHLGLRSHAARGALSYHQAHPTGSGKRRSRLANLLQFARKYPVLDAALYAYYFTRAQVVDMHEFNALYLRLAADEAAPPQRAALIRAYREVAEMRIRTLEASGGGSLLGLVQDEW